LRSNQIKQKINKKANHYSCSSYNAACILSCSKGSIEPQQANNSMTTDEVISSPKPGLCTAADFVASGQ